MSRTGVEQFDSVDEIISLYGGWGHDPYDEEISQLSHAVQCALLAQDCGASAELVIAALLHDVGHLMDVAEHGIRPDGFVVDMRHEATGAQALAKLFPASVTGPIALHVEAKRWRCAVDVEYLRTLSPASVASLGLQGGPMSAHERARFETHPQWRAATQLRNWDDTAKNADAVDPPFAAFVPLMRSVAR
ncbi:unannotated protein [freshwater metagenome]|uniref:Unannotated protein n=1 Tax=freshwater metagenome TaxID=449393 RepID=A0A6J7ECM5_9ZZZZ|nr:HD domain-containing protein [Actinomycetota bacterium]